MAGQAEARGVVERPERLQSDLDQLQARVRELEADNTHLRALLALTPEHARRPPGAQAALYDAAPGSVTATSSASHKVAFYRSLFACRHDVYAVRWDNPRTGAGGWMPAVRGGFRKDMRPADRQYLPLTEQVLTSHLSGQLEIGLYPLLNNDRCHWLAADFDGPQPCSMHSPTSKPLEHTASRPQPKSPVPAPAPTCGSSSPPQFPRRKPASSGPASCARP